MKSNAGSNQIIIKKKRETKQNKTKKIPIKIPTFPFALAACNFLFVWAICPKLVKPGGNTEPSSLCHCLSQ